MARPLSENAECTGHQTAIARNLRVLEVILRIPIRRLRLGMSFNGDEQFDTAIQVARHPVSTTDLHQFVTAVIEVEHACVFQESIDDADDCDVFAETRYTWFEAADAANIQADGHAGLRSAVEGVDQFGIDERMSLATINARWPCFLRSVSASIKLSNFLRRPIGAASIAR